MTDFLQRLKQRKLVQWAIAYVAFAFALIQVLDVVSDSYHWPDSAMHIVFGLLVLGFVVTVILAWYHGERGAQRISGPELLLIALALAIGGGLLWHFVRAPAKTAAATVAASIRVPNAAQRSQGSAAPPVASTSASLASVVSAIAAQPIPAKSVAVLPFENLNVDKKDAYFVAGIQDLILTKLADVGDLKVIARTSTAMYASHPENLTQIGEQLGVATILEGSVQKAGNQVLINVQLIDAQTDAHIWAQDYVRTLDNVFGVEGEVSEQIATALKAKLSASQSEQLAAVPTTNQAAYDAFLRAEYQANQAVNQGITHLRVAIPLYRQAIAQDPGFALAYARLSIVESKLARFSGGVEGVKQLFEQARTDAEQALKLAPALPTSQLALGYSDYYGKGDFTAALKAFDAALALRPNDADALKARGLVERRLGHFEAALASLTRAAAHNPRSTVIANFTGLACLELGRYPEAEAWSQRALALDPNNNDARDVNSRAILFSTGDVARALAVLQGDAPQLKRNRVSLLAYQRKYAAAIALLESIPDTPGYFRPAGAPIKVQELADLYRMAGDAAKARPEYAQALRQARALLAGAQGVHLVSVWYSIARSELGLGHTAEGLNAIAKARALGAESGDQAFGPWWLETSVSLYAEADRPDLAVPLLAKALVTPGIGAYYSPVLLWLDPAWDSIRHDPRFQALLKKYAKYKPAITYDAPTAASTSSATAG